ncbi:hypothetical protein [Flavobacterium sp. LB2R40]|uniref:hypothetical protein n=1 Tax=unclassified Flavobacterium TaxID=196869 RepID=UPI003AAEAAEF
MENIFRPNPNSFKNTFCVFNEVSIEAINKLKIQYDSKSGSKYYYTKIGMFRLSNHWGRLANSKWRLEPLEPETRSKIKLGFASWDSFYPDNALEELYYLEVNFLNNTINYQHRDTPRYDKKALLRTSSETTKRIKQARNILNLTSWAKYFESDDIELLRRKIINALIYTNKTLEEIKKEII